MVNEIIHRDVKLPIDESEMGLVVMEYIRLKTGKSVRIDLSKGMKQLYQYSDQIGKLHALYEYARVRLLSE